MLTRLDHSDRYIKVCTTGVVQRTPGMSPVPEKKKSKRGSTDPVGREEVFAAIMMRDSESMSCLVKPFDPAGSWVDHLTSYYLLAPVLLLRLRLNLSERCPVGSM